MRDENYWARKNKRQRIREARSFIRQMDPIERMNWISNQILLRRLAADPPAKPSTASNT